LRLPPTFVEIGISTEDTISGCAHPRIESQLGLVVSWKAASGTHLWTDTRDDGGDDAALELVMDSSESRAFVAGFVTHPDGDTDLLVQSYGVLSGAILWDDLYDKANDSDTAGCRIRCGSRLVQTVEDLCRRGRIDDHRPQLHWPKAGGTTPAVDAKDSTALRSVSPAARQQVAPADPPLGGLAGMGLAS
jgi:hypothetical protein